MAARAGRVWVTSWRRAADPEQAGNPEMARSFVVAGAELFVAMGVLRLVSAWRLGAWADAMSDLVPLVIKGTVLLAIPTWFFAFVAANAYGQAGRGAPSSARNKLRTSAAGALMLSATCAFLFWALPVWLTD